MKNNTDKIQFSNGYNKSRNYSLKSYSLTVKRLLMRLKLKKKEGNNMSMANDYCKASINLDRTNSRSTWTQKPNLSASQEEAYIQSEVRAREKMLSKFPHKYVAKIRFKKEGYSTVYDVKQVFSDGSILECLPMHIAEVDLLKSNGEIVEILD